MSVPLIFLSKIVHVFFISPMNPTHEFHIILLILYDKCYNYLMQFVFHPVEVVGKLVQKMGNKQMYTWGETIHKTQNTQNRK